ncbi:MULTISPECIES: glutamine--fructose-6-phosphate transaminase (isomerizing) [Bacillales]|jgi:glutamine---fructose-6-phosphate transaminase (isomerizing)|uniref:Glutamine--fructose-6-phosphate aminotransferase [isomerizing] n=1 Tax=Brevibacillus aydinogluensis TaxID=927786 RepID=A0AA48MCS0_9BACL|nr:MULTISPECIES: glutamine--fructose-6-phosphate transaminase (isomerizing) [Bacillales]REK65606.1 MAG: glutamine--fructose-6-phosphate transaminase (isomerizing) [Brevibacillus sp.]MBR8661750.1 glutamine--fructose-6-phosphate transaminase (isomerizing) [Brevibacillus sp. NL20B1]MDT3418060.1 glucosamine--fructose-6-phosphate aminotransferase (isomerizing) [Brevibacillus aydinogluensis]NNV04603.1 glutamine--fructose-6-phosphate transaminase (isomerizing) [Brevibacillus sp. MCWH]UFJ62454.1 gluta
MCGIVGYIGNRQAQEIIIGGLRKLEYRGYDSAGIAVQTAQGLLVDKAKGRLAVLEGKLAVQPLAGNAGIGHTRWATHGKPSDENAHPHTDSAKKFAVVHNGIIENFLPIKEELMAKGYEFTSETDTEVIAHLLADLYDGDIVSTVRKAVKRMRGAYALGIMTEHEPDKLVAVRLASPLIVGVGEGENFIGSDIPALLEHTRDVYILNEGEMAVLTRDGVELMDAETGERIERELFHVEWDLVQAEKGGYDSFMQKEIYEQPQAVRDTVSARIDEANKRVVLPELNMSDEELAAYDRIYIVACGTSMHAGLVGKEVIEKWTRVPVEVAVASEFRYRDPIYTDKTLMIVISQSGETADTLAALREAKKSGVKVLAITNVVGSSVAREADDVIFTWAGPEVAVASTKAYTSQVVALYLFALYFAQVKGTLAAAEIANVVEHLQQLPAKISTILENDEQIRRFAESIKDATSLFFIGRGLDYAVSLEGSLKLKEISYIHSEAYAAGELKHGTLALIEDNVPVVALATQPDIYEKMVSNIVEVKARGARVLGFAIEGDRELAKTVDDVIHIPTTLPMLTPILTVIPLQLLAYYASVARGLDVDKPRNLAKSVTVE